MEHIGININAMDEVFKLVQQIPVVNDACERMVQMASVFNDKGPKDEKR